MALSITHSYVSAVPDAGDASLVQPSDWNDTHDISGLGTGVEAALAVNLGSAGAVLITTSTIPLTIGSSTIASGTDTRILYNNAGVLGQYTLTGTGTVVAMQTAPSFLTSITTPIATITQGTITDVAPLINATTTWNDAADTFTAIKLDVTNTNSNAASKLIDLQVGSSTRFAVARTGNITYSDGSSTVTSGFGVLGGTGFDFQYGNGGGIRFGSASYSDGAGFQGFGGLTGGGLAGNMYFDYGSNARSVPARAVYFRSMTTSTFVNVMQLNAAGDVGFGSAQVVGWSSTSDASATKDTILARDAANTLALRNSTTAQTFRVYATADGSPGSNFQRLVLSSGVTSNMAIVAADNGGTGVAMGLQFGVALTTGGGVTNIANFNTSGHLLWNTDATYDIGASGATRPRNIYLSGSVTAGFVVLDGGNTRISILHDGGYFRMGGSGDVQLYRDAANTLALRNSTNAQAFRVYNTESSSLTNYERGTIGWDITSNTLVVGTRAGGTGTARGLNLDPASGVIKMFFNGSEGAILQWGARSKMLGGTTDGVILLSNNAGTAFTRLQFGSTTTSFPAIARNTTNLALTLADGTGAAGLGLGDIAAVGSQHTIVVRKTGIADATATAIITVTVPNAAHNAAIFLDILGHLGTGTDASESSRTATGSVVIARTSGADTVAVVSTLEAAQIATVSGGGTLTLAYDLSALTGASSATQTFTIRLTLTVTGTITDHTAVVSARLLNSLATGVTMAAA
jgi:hypothetical protein